jgi:hypothetical protein
MSENTHQTGLTAGLERLKACGLPADCQQDQYLCQKLMEGCVIMIRVFPSKWTVCQIVDDFAPANEAFKLLFECPDPRPSGTPLGTQPAG